MKLTKKLTNILILVGVILGGIGIDQLTKILVSKNMALYQSFSIIPKALNITYIQNRGAAFGMLANHRWVFMIVSTVAIIGICVYLFRFCNESMFFKIGLALIISGGIGNMIDRVFLGYVVDMIEATFIETLFGWSFAIFNVADSFVCVGACIVIFCLIRDIIKESKNEVSKNENK